MNNWFIISSLLIGGFFLFLIELFIIPGFGAIGIIGLIFIITGCYLLLKLSFLLGLLIGLVNLIVIIFLMKNFAKTKLWKKITLNTQENKNQGYSIQIESSENFLNKDGITLTSLRPSGAIEIEGKRLDVLTFGEFLEKGVKVKIVKIEGNKIVVEEIK
ncbi:MAG: NfeD family protein [bacterium]